MMLTKRYRASVYVLAAIAMAILLPSGHALHAQVAGVTSPSVPTGLTVAGGVGLQASLSWSASTESSGTVVGYYVYRNGAQLTTTAGTSMVDTAPLPGIYNYTVAAYDSSGNVSMQSSPVNVTLVLDTTPPSTPANVSVTGASSTNTYYAEVPLTISWSPSTDNVGVAGYFVYRNGIQIVSSTSAFTGTSVGDMVTPGTYTYTVVAYDAAQNYSNHSSPVSFTVSVDNTPPTLPTGLTAAQTSGTGVTVSWTGSTDSVGIAGYQIFRNGTQIATVGGPPYADSGLSVGVEYAYTVAAFDVAGNYSPQTSPAAVTLQTDNGPTVPSLYAPTLIGASTVQLSWSPSGGALPITGYNVFRNGTQIAATASTTYSDGGLASGMYSYTVTATDLGGAVSTSSEALNIFVPVPPIVPTSTLAAPIVSEPAPAAPTTTPAASGTAPAVAVSTPSTITEFLYYGLRDAQVQALQSLLAQNGYLTSAQATGFFGNLTLHAVQKFQCNENIVCTGGPGWGLVGPKTRSTLNDIGELQELQAELANLEKQL